MLRRLGEKLGVVNYIRGLFAERNATFRATHWDCVLRDGHLLVVRAFSKEPADVLIMSALLDCDRLPSWYETYIAVGRNWPLLTKAEISS